MGTRNLNNFFKELAAKALGESRGSQLVFKDLRDSYNEAILDSNVNEEIKDTLMGHLRKGAKASYSLSIATVVRVYQEEIYPKLAVNGWNLKKKASEADKLKELVENLQSSLNQLETDNIAYRTRIDNLHEQVSKLVETEANREAQFERLNQYIYESIMDAEDSGLEAVKVMSRLPEDYDFILIPKKVKTGKE